MYCGCCGKPVRRSRSDEGYNIEEIPWTHTDGGGPGCDDGYLDEATGEWHDQSFTWYLDPTETPEI